MAKDTGCAAAVFPHLIKAALTGQTAMRRKPDLQWPI
jgi:hypothetical protein